MPAVAVPVGTLRARIREYIAANPGALASTVYHSVLGGTVPLRAVLRDMILDGELVSEQTRGRGGGERVRLAVEVSQVPEESGDIDLDELRARRKAEFARVQAADEAGRLIPVKVNVPGPIAIWHCGDPHLDDPGTDLATLERHCEIVARTPGMFAGSVGDVTNNWIGRLARLHAEQSTTAREAWALAEWFVGAVPWLYMVAGNHDAWSGAGDPLRWITRQAGALYRETNARLELRGTGWSEAVRVNVRHDFAGHSQWNPAHGVGKAAQLGVRDHILVCGHKHVSGYMPIKDPETGLITHAVQVASYKRFDRYAREKGFRDQAISPCAVTVIDPQASPASRVQVFWEPEPASEYLVWLRRRRGCGGKKSTSRKIVVAGRGQMGDR